MVLQGHDAPDATGQQLFELAHVRVRHLGIFDAQVGQQRLVRVALFIELDRNLVDHLKRAALADLALDLLGLVRAHIVLGQHTLDGFQPGFDGRGVVRCAVHAQQVLQNVYRDIGPFLDELRQVFADHFAAKVLIEQLIQPAIQRGACLGCKGV